MIKQTAITAIIAVFLATQGVAYAQGRRVDPLDKHEDEGHQGPAVPGAGAQGQAPTRSQAAAARRVDPYDKHEDEGHQGRAVPGQGAQGQAPTRRQAAAARRVDPYDKHEDEGHQGRDVPGQGAQGQAPRNGRGAGPNRNFYKGSRLPTEYRHRQYVVNDWRAHHLSAPPRGHQWVQVGGDYVLVAIATGIIAQLLLGN